MSDWLSSAETRSGKNKGGFCVPTAVVVALAASIIVWGILVWMKARFLLNQDGSRNWAKVLGTLLALAVVLGGLALIFSSRCGGGKKMCFRMPCA